MDGCSDKLWTKGIRFQTDEDKDCALVFPIFGFLLLKTAFMGA
jgi:hypothetical protein